MSSALLHLFIRRKCNAGVVCKHVQFESWFTLARIRCNTSAIDASIIIFCFWITNRMANVRLTCIVAKSIAHIAFTWIWINASPMNAFNGTMWFAQIIIAIAQFETIHTDACLIQANSIDTVTALSIGAITSCWIIDTCFICRCTNALRVLFKSIVT